MSIFRSILLFVFIYSIIPSVFSQNYFQKTYTFHQPANFFFEVEVLPDGRMATLTGTVQPQDSTGQVNLLLLDAKGEIIWSKLLVTGRTTYSATMTLASDGNLAIAMNGLDLAGNALNCVLKVAVASGDILWESYFKLPSDHVDFGVIGTGILRIISLQDGGYAVVANKPTAYFLYLIGLSTVFKLNETGQLQWERALADSQSVVYRNVAENSQGELFVTGVKGDSAITQQTIVTKLSPGGTILWNKGFKTGFIRNIEIDAQDNVWLSGLSRDPALFILPWVQKMTADGDLTWSKTYQFSLPEKIELAGMTIMPDGDAVITGHHPSVDASNAVLARINPAGALVWAKKYAASGENDYLLKVRATASGDIVAGGASGKSYMDLDAWLIKTDPEGNIPNCCLQSCTASTMDVPTTFHSFNLITSDTIESDTGSTIYVLLPPRMNTFCSTDVAADPNAFTPNGDQVNDRFVPRYTCPPETIQFTIFNRWGNKVFETNDPDTPGWDGTSDAQDAPSDLYFWILEYDTFINGSLEKKQEKGDLTLLR